MKLNTEQIDIIITKKLTGELSEEEHAQFNAWYSASTENKEFFEAQTAIWESFSQKDIPPEEIDIEFRRLEQRLNIKEESKPSSIWQRAAAIAALLIVGFSYVLFFASTETHFQANESRLAFVLKDQSRIQLNRFSRLSYSETDELRNVKLDGEAFFEVAHDGRPFIVETKGSKVEVLGTKFTVHEENGVTTVAVREGKVRLTNVANETSVLLTRGMFANSSNRIAQSDSLLFSDLTAWLRNRIVFREQRLETVVQELEKQFQISIEVKSEKLQNVSISASLLSDDAERLLNSLAELVNASLEKNERGFVIVEK
jgi:transmembrane sensor